MKAANKDGWIRHRGGKCPVALGAKVDYRMRCGSVDSFGRKSDTLDWDHYNEGGDIMAYRLHKSDEQQSETMSKIADECAVLAGLANKLEEQVDDQADLKAAAKNAIDPLEWRDRITTIDFDIHSLTNERAELVRKLASEGLQLLDVEKPVAHPVEDMSDWRNWKSGDIVEAIDKSGGYSPGRFYEIRGIDLGSGSVLTVSDDLGSKTNGWNHRFFKFHCRKFK